MFKIRKLILQLLQNWCVKGEFLSYIYCVIFLHLLEKKLQKKSKIKEMDKELQHTHGESNNNKKGKSKYRYLFVRSFFFMSSYKCSVNLYVSPSVCS